MVKPKSSRLAHLLALLHITHSGQPVSLADLALPAPPEKRQVEDEGLLAYDTQARA